jgi:hypothetical protein
MSKLSERFSFLKDPKIMGLAGFFILVLVGLPIILSQVQQKQEIRQKAANFQQVVGDNFTIDAKEVPSCPDGQVNNINSYGGSFIVTSKKNQTVNVVLHRFFCPEGVFQSCEKDDQAQPLGSKTFTVGQQMTFTADPRQASAPYTGQACGTYQIDLEFVNFNKDYKYQSAFWCQTRTNCTTPTPTPFSTSTPTPPTDTPTPSSSPTPSDTPTPSMPPNTPTPSATPSATPTPTGTLTPTPTGTLTPTVTPTPGPSSTATPIIATNTPRPSLPPTGPQNNNIVAGGIIGTIVAILGGLLLLGL